MAGATTHTPVCLIVVSFQQSRDYPLIVAANRDEFYKRAAAPLDWWPDAPQVLAGADISQNTRGTWLGVNRHGRFAAVTNFRQPGKERKDAASRGLIVRRFLEANVLLTDFARELVETAGDYNGYNLLFGTKDELWYYNNCSGKPPAPVHPGLHALSNALLDTPWPKTLRAVEKFRELNENPPAMQNIFDLLADSTQAGKHQVQRTGLPLKYEIALSSIFIRQKFRRGWFSRSVGYGTRASSYLTFAHSGDIEFSERTYIDGKPAGDKTVRFCTSHNQ